MAGPKRDPDYKQLKRNPGIKKNRTAIIAVAVVIAVLIIVYFSYSNSGASGISVPATANLTSSGTLFNINSQQYLISFAGAQAGSSKAYVHLTRLPVFENPLLNVTLTLNNITKVNAGTTYANIGIELASLGHGQITVKVSPLATSLQVDPDSQYISVIEGTLYTSGQAASSTVTSTVSGSSNQITTTIASVTSKTTSAPTTTIKATNTTALEINQTLDKNYTYSLLLNFSKLYANTSNCTLAHYNLAYDSVYGSVPTGPNTYQNTSLIVPYEMIPITSKVGSSNYDVNFTTKAKSSFYNNKVAVTLQVDPASGKIVKQAINSTGIFAGESINQIETNYTRASGEGACGVEV